MKIKSIPLFGLVLLVACQPVTPAASTPEAIPTRFTCDTPGTVQTLNLDLHDSSSYEYWLYLPPCYEADAGRLYPVLYLVPGRTSGPGTWFAAGAAPVADELILSGEVPPFIIVTTQNTDFDMFAETITNELVPYIEGHYRLSPERRHHAVAGGSLGGIAAYRIGFRDPDKFAAVGMFGSGAIHGEEKQIRAWLGAMTLENKVRVFLNSGFDDPLMLDRARVMMSLLDEFNIPHTHIFTEGGHNYAYWASNLPAFFHWLALDW